MIKEERKHLDEIIGTITKRAKERWQLYKELNRQETSEPELDDTNTALKELPGDETPEGMPLLQVRPLLQFYCLHQTKIIYLHGRNQ